jgi:hypothetical protein
MTTQHELDRMLGDFFLDGTDELADRVLDAALDQIEDTTQRRPMWAPRRFSPMNLPVRFGMAAVIAIIAVGGALYVFRPGSSVGGPGSSVPASSAPTPAPTAQNPLIGTWTTGPTTCAQQNAALAKAGFTAAQLQSDGWDAATCAGMKHGSAFRLQFTNTLLVFYQDGVAGWTGTYQAVDGQTFKAGDSSTLYITYHYAIVGDQLTIDMVADTLPTASGGEQLGEDIAQTVIYETATFTRQP